MKRYCVHADELFCTSSIEDEHGQWVPAEVAQEMYDALRDQIDLSEHWINQYLSISKSSIGGISDSDYRIWLATGHRSNAMAKSRKALSLADGEE